MKKVIIAIALFGFIHTGYAQKSCCSKKHGAAKCDMKKCVADVKESVLAFHKAVFLDKDSLALENLLAPEVTYGHSGGKLENRAEVVDHCSHNSSTYSGVEANDVTVIVNSNTAVTRYLLSGIENKHDGKAVELHLNILQTWVKGDSGWKMLARQAVKVK